MTALRRLVAPSGRLTRWSLTAVAVWLIAWTVALVAVVIEVIDAGEPLSMSYWVMDVVSAFVYGAAALVMLPRSRHFAAWIISMVAVGCGLSGLATQYALLGMSNPTLPGVAFVAVTGSWIWIPGTYLSMSGLPWVVTSRTVPRWAYVVVLFAVGLVAAAVVRVATLDYAFFDNPTAVASKSWQHAMETVGLWPERAIALLGLAGSVWLLHRWRRDLELRAGLGWLLVGQLFIVLAFLPVAFVRMTPEWAEVSGVALIAAQVFLPVSLLVLVLRHQLWGIDVTVSRVTVWGLLTGLVLAGYAALAWAAERVVPEARGAAGLLAVGLVIALGQPLRSWLQRRVDLLIYGAGVDPAHLLGSLSRDFGEGRSGTSLDHLVDTLRVGLRLGGVEVRASDGGVRAVSGRVEPADLELPLAVEGRPLGKVRVAAVTGQRLDPRTRRAVEQMVGVIGVSLELVQVNEQLAGARDRLVEVRQEERRMLRRDLHDGMGPALAGVGLGLAAAQRRLTHDPAGTAALLAELEAEVERRTEDVRLMARALLPAQLDDGDLDRALGVLADRFRASGIEVDVAYGLEEQLTTRYQIAVYHVAAEALMNAYRHARATTVSIVVRSAASGVELEVADDGRGLGDASDAGVGLRSMRERAAELAGELSVAARADGPGTRVWMVLP